jgi:hypothetical protein
MISRILAVLTLLALSASASAFTARTGHWYNPAESGSGYNIDIQDGVLVVTIFSYKPGDSEWYISSGPMSASQSTYTGSLLAVRGGQCISCAYTAPSSTINSGTIVITFTSETSATVLLPGGRMTTIRPFNFGFGTPPQGLLGQWVYVETIAGVDFADRYSFTTILGATAEGNGIVNDFDKFASCELQITGEIAGLVVCGHWTDSTYTVALDVYAYELGLDQTYNGLWISPTTETAYPMKGYMSISRSGFSNASVAAATPPDDLSQRALKRQAETADPSSRISAMRSSGYSTAVAAAIEKQGRALRGLP